jgi:hypothetical protein
VTRALSEQEIRSVIHTHPDVFGEIARLDAQTAGELSHRVTEILFANPQVVDSVVAAGMGLAPDGISNLGAFMRWLAAARILMLTQGAHSPEALVNLFYSEFARLAFDVQPSDRLMQLIFGEGALQ